MDDAAIQRIADRLEFRGQDRTFLELLEAYLDKMAMPHVIAEVGKGSFFLGAAETYAPLISKAGLLPPNKVDNWLAEQRRSSEEGTFFAACNYYTYLARRG